LERDRELSASTSEKHLDRERRRLALMVEYDDKWEDDSIYDEELALGDEDFAHMAAAHREQMFSSPEH
jgi:hypothetical protein